MLQLMHNCTSLCRHDLFSLIQQGSILVLSAVSLSKLQNGSNNILKISLFVLHVQQVPCVV